MHEPNYRYLDGPVYLSRTRAPIPPVHPGTGGGGGMPPMRPLLPNVGANPTPWWYNRGPSDGQGMNTLRLALQRIGLSDDMEGLDGFDMSAGDSSMFGSSDLYNNPPPDMSTMTPMTPLPPMGIPTPASSIPSQSGGGIWDAIGSGIGKVLGVGLNAATQKASQAATIGLYGGASGTAQATALANQIQIQKEQNALNAVSRQGTLPMSTPMIVGGLAAVGLIAFLAMKK